jgi:dihydroorotate dehydrogenase (fumarate)
MEPDISVKFGGKIAESPFGNAAGVRCTTIEDMEKLDKSSAGIWVSKTGTLESREGNPKPRFAFVGGDSINSMGLPNIGIDHYIKHLSKVEKENPKKVRFFSVSAIKQGDTAQLLKKIAQSDYTGNVELNLSCPNVVGKPQTGYDRQSTIEAIEDAFNANGGHNPIGLKLPPYFDLVHFDRMAEIFNRYPIAFINSVNSIGNGLDIDAVTGETMIAPKNGVGGIGGDAILKTALSNVYNFRTRLKSEIQIIGTGGIKNAETAVKHIRAGADIMGIGTALQREDVEIFDRLNKELKEFMIKYNIPDLSVIRGKIIPPQTEIGGREQI